MALTANDPYRILVVDDDPRNTEILKTKLESEGFAVFAASEGEGALFAFEQYRPNMVLLDVMMPGMDGKEVCAALKARCGKSFVPVLLITAVGGDEARVEGFSAGADDYLSKPVDFVELLLRIRNLRRLQALTAFGAELSPRDATYQVGRMPVDEVFKAVADLLGTGRRTMLRVTSQDRCGYIAVAESRFIYARIGAVLGSPALDEMLLWPAAHFETITLGSGIRSNADVAFDDVLSWWLNHLDPWRVVVEKLPPRHTLLIVNPVRAAEIARQRQELRATAGLFAERISVDQAVRLSTHDVVTSLQLVAELFYRGLLIRSGEAPKEFVATPPPLKSTDGMAPAPMLQGSEARAPVHGAGSVSELSEEIASLRIEVLSLTASADHLRNENAELRTRLSRPANELS